MQERELELSSALNDQLNIMEDIIYYGIHEFGDLGMHLHAFSSSPTRNVFLECAIKQ